MTRTREPYRVQPQNVAGGCHHRRGMRQMSVQFDEETYQVIHARAVAAGTGFGEQVRLLVEWGLEADEKA
jgi:hypothetical protein